MYAILQRCATEEGGSKRLLTYIYLDTVLTNDAHICFPNSPIRSYLKLGHSFPRKLFKRYQKNATETHVKGWTCYYEIIPISCTQQVQRLSAQITTSCVVILIVFFCGLVCYGLMSLVSFSGFWHWRVPWWSCLPFLGSVNNERCRSMINYYTFCVLWSWLGYFISLLISKSMYYYVCQYEVPY